MESKNFFVHSAAIVEPGATIGAGSRVWAFTHILPGAVIGNDCNICDSVFVENDVFVGDRVTIKCGVQLWDGVRLEDDVFIGPNVTFTNDSFPRSKQYPDQFAKTIVKQGASIGANATILPGIVVGRKAMVGAGAVVTHNVPPHAIVVGNPARIVGYAPNGTVHKKEQVGVVTGDQAGEVPVRGVKIVDLPLIKDLRGNLSVAEIEKGLPFVPQRCFWVFDVPSKDVRGEHAHRTLEQFLVCLKGSCAVMVDDGENRVEVQLERPNRGLYIPPKVWGVQYKFTADAVLLVFASDKYDAPEYIRDYDEFLKVVGVE
ncbi:MAG: WxcM-like domain-containing protein [Anaerolineales bacterium]|nr:WxcM-like domain-containing protein [Anaerolineales bacterium]